MGNHEGRLEYILTEMVTGSTVLQKSDWTSTDVIIKRENCKEGFFDFIYNSPLFISPFVFKWNDSFCTIDIRGSRIVKPDENELIFIDPVFCPLEDTLSAVEQVEQSREHMERHRVD